MPWNWQLPDWPRFKYDDQCLSTVEKQFFIQLGRSLAFLKSLDEHSSKKFIVEILSMEGEQSAKIEGEVLDRESLQSSIKRHFGLQDHFKRIGKKEANMAELLINVYETFDEPLTHEMLCQWHSILFKGQSHIEDIGKYRTHLEPMQIVSNRFGSSSIYFEAPPSAKVYSEMTAFIKWFNDADSSQSILSKAAIAHVYFESIHPFEDGNGRIGRVLVQKILSQALGKPVLIALSKVLERRKKDYYSQLERCNRTLEVQDWVVFFAEVIVHAQEESMTLLYFLIEKTKALTALVGQLNERQEELLLRMFAEGPSGFKGGLSADNYISITKASRATATRDLADLVEKGALVRKGELRHTRYYLNIRSDLHG